MAVLSAYLCQFPAGKNVQVAGDIACRQRLLTTLFNNVSSFPLLGLDMMWVVSTVFYPLPYFLWCLASSCLLPLPYNIYLILSLLFLSFLLLLMEYSICNIFCYAYTKSCILQSQWHGIHCLLAWKTIFCYRMKQTKMGASGLLDSRKG